MKIYNYIIVLLSFVLISPDLLAQQRGQQQEQEVKIPIQLKPKRLELLNKISNDSIKQDMPFHTEEELEEIKRLLKLEKKISQDNLVNKDIKQRYTNIKLGFTSNQNFRTVKLSYGFTTTIVFLDKNGNPWDLFDYSVGDSSLYDIQFRQKNIITLLPKKYVGSTNLTLMFKGAKMPLSINLELNDEVVDYIAQVDLDDYGNQSPSEQTFVNDSIGQVTDLSYLAKFEDDFMSSIITNTKPEGFEEKEVLLNDELINENEFRMFLKDQFLYVRTRHHSHSPAPIKVRRSADGETKVYKIPFITSPMFIIDGKVETLRVR